MLSYTPRTFSLLTRPTFICRYSRFLKTRSQYNTDKYTYVLYALKQESISLSYLKPDKFF